MALMRLQNNVPEVYVEESRDFQLLCRIFDAMINGVKFDIDTVAEITDTKICNNRILSLLESRVGFFSDTTLDDESLRYIIKSFSYLLPNKGTFTGIKDAIYVFLKTQRLDSNIQIQISNAEYFWQQDDVRDPYGVQIEDPKTIDDYTPRYLMHIYDDTNSYTAELNDQTSYRINIGFNTLIKLDLTILKAILRYIIPTGYIVDFFNYITLSELTQSYYRNYEGSNLITISDNINSQIRGTSLPFSNTSAPFIQFNSNESKLVRNSIIGAVDTVWVISSEDIMNTPQYNIDTIGETAETLILETGTNETLVTAQDELLTTTEE